jgi:putative ABC transport system substrate-binding protein
MIRRREFIAGLGYAAAWPVVARAQQGDRIPWVGVLMVTENFDTLSAFTQGLEALNWTDGRNVRIDVRWGGGTTDVVRIRRLAKELVDLQPDVILASGTPLTAALQRETRTIPIVFVNVSDPVGDGLVAGLPRPGGNITGFIGQEGAMAGKWLQLLTEIAPSIKRVAALFNPAMAARGGSYFLPPFEAAARSLKVQPIAAPVHSDAEVETIISSLGREPGGGLVVMPDGFMISHPAPTILLAARHKLPAVYPRSSFVTNGGLLSYGPDQVDLFRRAAPYVDRILRGAKPAELPVQVPTKFEMAVNLKTAKALGLTIPETLLATADEVIQ